GKRDFLFLQEARDFGLRLGVIERDGEERYILVSVLGCEFGEHGHFFAAWEAPGGPEVEDDDFASGNGEGVRFAGEVVERKRGRAQLAGGVWRWRGRGGAACVRRHCGRLR